MSCCIFLDQCQYRSGTLRLFPEEALGGGSGQVSRLPKRNWYWAEKLQQKFMCTVFALALAFREEGEVWRAHQQEVVEFGGP